LYYITKPHACQQKPQKYLDLFLILSAFTVVLCCFCSKKGTKKKKRRKTTKIKNKEAVPPSGQLLLFAIANI
jgi:hypothetical protein